MSCQRRTGGARDRGRQALGGGAVRGLPRARRGRRAQLLHLGRRRRTRATPDGLAGGPTDAGSRSSDSAGQTPLRGVPLAVKDLFCTAGVPSQSGSRILEGYRPPYTATAVARLAAAGAPLLGEDQPGRVRDGLLQRELRLRAGPEPVGSHARPRRLLGRERRRRRRGPRAVGARDRHGRLDPPARRAVRDRRPETDLRRGLALRDDRLRLLARPGRAADARRDRRRAAALRRWSARTRATRPRSPSPSRSRCRAPSAWTACGSACPRSSAARASTPACSTPSTPRSHRAEELGASIAGRCACRTRRTRSRPTTCWRPPSAPRTSPASTACATARRAEGAADLLDMYTRTRHDGFGAGGQAADHARHLRALGRLLRRLLRPRAARAHEDRAGLRRGLRRRSTSSSPRPARRSRSASARRPATRGRCTSTTSAPCRCRWPASPRSRSPAASAAPASGPAGAGLPVGFQIAGPVFSENRLLDAAYALEQALGFDGSAARA